MDERRIRELYRKVGTTDEEEAWLEVAREAEDYVPRCDLCGRRYNDSPAPFEGVDWNAETGNHETCESSAHRASPVADHLGVLTCAVCHKPVRTAFGGKYAVHAMVG